MQSKCEKRKGGNVAVAGGRRKKQMLQKGKKKKKESIFKERDGVGKPRRGSCGSTCLLRHKCDSAPPGPGKTQRTNEQQGIGSLSSFISLFYFISS